MKKGNIKKSIFAKIRNNFIAGIVVLIPIGITLYLTLFIIRISGNFIPKEINPNNYLPFDIPGVEILIALFFFSLLGWLSLSFIGKKFFELFNNFLKRIPILRTIYSAIGQMTESFTKTDNTEKSVDIKMNSVIRLTVGFSKRVVFLGVKNSVTKLKNLGFVDL